MSNKKNSRQIKLLHRVLDSLTGFELIVCGYRSLPVYRKTKKTVEDRAGEKGFQAINADMSTLDKVGKFEDLLKDLLKKHGRENQYVVFNVTGMESHVKDGEPSPFLNHLNLIRDRFATDFPYAFFFWLPEIQMARFTLDAPDLWAWRNTALVFEDEEKKVGIDTSNFILSQKKTVFDNFTASEKRKHLQHLQKAIPTLQKKVTTWKGKKNLANAYSELGDLLFLLGNIDEALGCYKNSLGIFQVIEEQREIGYLLFNIGLIYYRKGDYENAGKYLSRGSQNIEKLFAGKKESFLEKLQKELEQHRRNGDKSREQTTLHMLAEVHHIRGDIDKALEYIKKSLSISVELGDKYAESVYLMKAGSLYAEKDDEENARLSFEKSLKIAQESGFLPLEASVSLSLATIYLGFSSRERALQCIQRGMEINAQIHNEDIANQLKLIPKELLNMAKSQETKAK